MERYDEGEDMAKRPDYSPDTPLTPEALERLRSQFAKLSITGLYDAYNAAWLQCKVERNGRAPRAENVQEFVQVWKELRKAK
jgi:hypothetical protein